MKREDLPSTRKIISYVGYAVAIVFLVLMAVHFRSGLNSGTDEKTLKTGSKPVVVVTGSMEPIIKVNSISIMKYCTINDLKVGDIVMYKYNNMQITHRVMSITEIEGGGKFLTTKGDANKYPDNVSITSQMVIGKLTKTYNGVAPYISYFMLAPGEINFAAVSQVILFLIVFIAIASIVLYNLMSFITAIIAALSGDRKFKRYIRDYKKITYKQQELQEQLEAIANSDDNKIVSAIAKARAIKEIKALKQSMKDFEKGLKFIKTFKGIFHKH